MDKCTRNDFDELEIISGVCKYENVCTIRGLCPMMEFVNAEAVEAHSLYAKYANGDEICWGFECTCKHQGKCDTCPDLAEYNDYCTKEMIK